MGVPSLEMTVLMVFPLLWTNFCFPLVRRNSISPWSAKNFSNLALQSRRDQADSHGGQTSREYPVKPRARSVGMSDFPIVSRGSNFLKSAVGCWKKVVART